MKKLINTLMMVLLTYPLAIFGQVYQLPNPGFEYWDNNYANSSDEPTNWNGFPTADCSIIPTFIACPIATETRHERVTDAHSGNYSCKIFATDASFLTTHAIANGNITTGQISIGSSTAAEATKNYNFTKRSDASLSQPFNGKPDSISFWTKFSCPSTSQFARMSCIIHDNYDMHDPYTTDEQTSHIVGEVVKEYLQTNGAWVEYRVPINYNHTATTPAYILLTFTTNKVPGEGSVNDIVWIDDITMIYHAELSDLKSGGVTVPGFNANTLEYNVELAFGANFPEVTYTTLSPRATATVTQPTTENPTATVVVTHGDQTKTYTIHYTFASEMDAALSDLRLNDETVNGFDPAVTDYSVVIIGTEIPTVSATPRNSEATVEITQPTAENPVATVQVTDRDSSRTYTVNITMVEPNADLSDLRLDDGTINGFDPAVTEYTLTDILDNSIPVLSATAASEYATLAISQPEEAEVFENMQYVGTVTVTCGELTKTYTVTINYVESITEQFVRSFTLYPNPTNGQITISLDENVMATEAAVYNTMGQTVMTQPVNDSRFEMNLNSLQSGIYFVAVRNGNKVVGIQKIVKE